MAQCGKPMTKIAAFTVAWLAYSPAIASTFSGELPVGYSDNLFQIVGATSSLGIDILALGSRDPAICGACYSSYTDNYTVNLFDQSGSLLKSVNETNYFYYSLYNNSHGIGAGPVPVSVPVGATTFEIVSRLYVGGLLGTDGLPLTFGELNIFADGPITSATPLPSTLPLLATGLVALGLIGWRGKRAASNAFA